MKYIAFYATIFFAAFSTAVFADDAIEAAATGNITFEKTPEISMLDEVLRISQLPDSTFLVPHYKITVDFQFINHSDKTITRKIVFALPPADCSRDSATAWRGLVSGSIGPDKIYPLRDFTGTVDGKPVKYTQRVEAIKDGRVINDLLNKYNVPLSPCAIPFTDNGEPVPPLNKILKEHHLVNQYQYPNWVENAYFEWTQTFPPGKVVRIHHEYTPVTGSSVPSLYTEENIKQWFMPHKSAKDIIWSRNMQTLGMTSPQAVRRDSDANSDSSEERYCVVPSWVRYKLTTGANWIGGIESFKLIIDGNQDALFAVNHFFDEKDKMISDVKPKQMVFTARYFVPKRDLLVMYLAVGSDQSDLAYCGI